MENLDRLFRDAKRIKPDEAMWSRIAAGAEAAKASTWPSAEAPERGAHRGWRLAAAFAIGVGALSALMVSSVTSLTPATQAPQASLGAQLEEGMDDMLEWHADLGEGVLWDDDVLPLLFEE